MRHADQIQNSASSIQVQDIPEWLMSESKRLSFHHGDFVMRCQDPISHIFLVLSGSLSIMSVGENGQESVVASLGRGCLLGEMEALVGRRHSTYSARCGENAELVSFPAEAFVRWAREDGRVSWILAQMMAEKLYNASRQSSTMTSARGIDRLIACLIQERAGRVRRTRLELAERCSVSLRTINRCVQRLRREGLIDISRGKIVISSEQMDALKQISKL